MSDKAMGPAPEPRSTSEPAHETSDASGLYVSIFALALVAAIGLVLLLLVWVFDHFESQAERHDPVESPLAVDQVPPAPRLEDNSGKALSELRAREDDELTNIDRTIELLAERGLPEPEGPAEPEVRPGASDGKAGPEKKPGAP